MQKKRKHYNSMIGRLAALLLAAPQDQRQVQSFAKRIASKCTLAQRAIKCTALEGVKLPQLLTLEHLSRCK